MSILVVGSSKNKRNRIQLLIHSECYTMITISRYLKIVKHHWSIENNNYLHEHRFSQLPHPPARPCALGARPTSRARYLSDQGGGVCLIIPSQDKKLQYTLNNLLVDNADICGQPYFTFSMTVLKSGGMRRKPDHSWLFGDVSKSSIFQFHIPHSRNYKKEYERSARFYDHWGECFNFPIFRTYPFWFHNWNKADPLIFISCLTFLNDNQSCHKAVQMFNSRG